MPGKPLDETSDATGTLVQSDEGIAGTSLLDGVDEAVPEPAPRPCDAPLFQSSLLLFSDESMEELARASVGIVGIGGVGAIAAEMLARMGVGSFRVADHDDYEPANLGRQLFATRDTLGHNKAACAADRLSAINPDCRVTAFEEGLRLANARDMLDGLDVVISQGDTPSSIMLTHRVASEFGIPVISGARASVEHRWQVKAKIWNYRANPETRRYDEEHYPDLAAVPFERLTQSALDAYDLKDRRRRSGLFRERALADPGSFESIDPDALRERIANHPEAGNRHVCAVLANTAGCLAATCAVKIILGGPEHELEIDLWNGS